MENNQTYHHPYCQLALSCSKDHPHRIYHDSEYGFPIKNDDELFGRLILEINQAGLNWLTILKKKESFRIAYANFNLIQIAQFQVTDIDRLMNNAGIIRNRKKIEAAIYNAQVVIDLQKVHGSFYAWLEKNKTLNLDEWTLLFKKNFKFTGRLIVEEFLMSIGIVEGAHSNDCLIYNEILLTQPIWLMNKKKNNQ